jgi:phosphatidate cytidylyltransferase
MTSAVAIAGSAGSWGGQPVEGVGKDRRPMSEQDDPGRDRHAHSWTERFGSDFPMRLVAGLVMAAVVAAFTLAGEGPFALLVVLGALIVAWEWGRLVHGTEGGIVTAVLVATAALAGSLAAFGLVGLGLLALPIGAILAALLSLGRNSMYSALGVFYAGLPTVALIWLRADPTLGLLAVIFLIAIVATADTAGFLAGRLAGGAKLWPRVSPNKTWAGLLGALAASAIVGALFWFSLPYGSAIRLAATGAVLAAVAQAGDLAESALKRRFGAKDTGTIIPGHGGLMDRVDGLIAAAVAAGICAFLVNWYFPARALLLGS